MTMRHTHPTRSGPPSARAFPVRRLPVLVLAIAAATLGAWSPLVAQSVRGEVGARLAGRLDAATHTGVMAQLDSARLAGLPVDPLVDRALEGASKRALGRPVSGDDIVQAVRRLRGALGSARTALGGRATTPELVAGASALQARVGAEALVALRLARNDAPLTVPLGVLTDLVTMGVPADTAARTVISLARSRDAVLLAYQRDVERDIGVGALPAVAASVRAAGLERADAAGLHSMPLSGSNMAAPMARPPAPRKP